MRTKKVLATYAVAAFIIFGGQYAFADEVLFEQLIHTTEISSSTSSSIWKIGTGLEGELSTFSAWVNRVGTTGIFEIEIRCFTESTYTTRCPNTEMGGQGHTLEASTTLSSSPVFTTVEFWRQPTSTTYRTFVATRYYDARYSSVTAAGAGVGDIDVYGTSTPNVCYTPSSNGGCTGSPYAAIATGNGIEYLDYLDPFHITEENATSTVLEGAYSAFNFVDSFLEKFPINWVTEFAAIIEGLQDDTATTTIPEMTVDFGTLETLQNIPTTTPMDLEVTFFSAAQLNEVAEIPAMQTMRTIAAGLLWFGLAMYGFRAATRLFAAPQG